MESAKITQCQAGPPMPPVWATLVYLLLLLNAGCIERHYTYKINLDGSCDFTYLARGDSADIYDPLGSYPEEPFFSIQTSNETDTSGKITHSLEASAHYSHDSIPATFGLREVPWSGILLHQPAKFNCKKLFFGNLYKFELALAGRRRMTLEGDRWQYIPPECRVLESDEDSLLSDAERAVLEEKYAAGLLIWNVERYKLRFREIITATLDLHPEIQIEQVWVDSAMTELDSLLMDHFKLMQIQASGGLDQISLEWWEALEPQAKRILVENLSLFGDSTLAAQALRVAELLEMRHQVGEDLMDESFEIRVDLPGRTLQSRAPVMEKGVLVWKYLGEDLQESDVILEASSLYLFSGRIVGFLALIAILIVMLIYRKSRRAKTSVGLPPPPPRRN